MSPQTEHLLRKFLVCIVPCILCVVVLSDFSSALHFALNITWGAFCGWELWPLMDKRFKERQP